MGREKSILKGTPMTPVGIVAVILGLAASYQIATRGPGLLAATIAVVIAVVLRTLSVRASRQILALQRDRSVDPWARPTRAQRRALAGGLRTTMSLTTLTSMFPQQTVRGYAIANRLRLA
jgi:hypothetical protein